MVYNKHYVSRENSNHHSFSFHIAFSETNEFFYYICQYNFITSDEIIYDEYNNRIEDNGTLFLYNFMDSHR